MGRPNLADGRWRYGGADAEVFDSIFYGRPKGMPAFGGTLGAEGVWTLVAYLRSLPVAGRCGPPSPGSGSEGAWICAVMALVGALATGAAAMAADSAVGADSVTESIRNTPGPAIRICARRCPWRKALAWVKAQNARSTAILQADPSYQKYYDAILRVMDASDRIPYGTSTISTSSTSGRTRSIPRESGGVLASRTTRTRRPTGTPARPGPGWRRTSTRTGCGRARNARPSLQRCLLHLSRGGGDAVVVREFDPAAKVFVKDGFQLRRQKSSISYLTEDSVLCGTDFGPASMTASGYPRIVKLWKRGEPLSAARVIYEGKHDDVGVQGVVFHDPAATIELVQPRRQFFNRRISGHRARRHHVAVAAAARRRSEGRTGP